MLVSIIYSELVSLRDEEKARVFPRFFKTGKGEYGEGDKFIGVTVPNIRAVAKKHADSALESIEPVLCSEWHEMRMCALLILVEKAKSTRKAKWLKLHSLQEAENRRKEIYDFYLNHTERINNWDLVDLTAPTIVGEYLLDKDRSVIYELANSPCLWEQRISIISTLALIRNGEFDDTFLLSSMLMSHSHDLIHKSVGWMLREAGKRNKPRLMSFLDENAVRMPRTMLRYAIEKFTESERRYYMNL